MQAYYAIDFNLNIVQLGVHPSFESADEAAQKLGIDVMYLASRESLVHLSNELEKVFFEKSGFAP